MGADTEAGGRDAPEGEGTPATVEELLMDGKERSGGGTALHLGKGRDLDHAALEDLLDRAREDLRELGIGRRTRVMTALPDGPFTACVLLTLLREAVCAPVNPDLRQVEIEALVPELGAELLVVHGPAGEDARRAAATLGLPVVEVDWDGARSLLRWRGEGLGSGGGQGEAATPDETALVLLTSGSSARPKRVPLTHRHLALSAARLAASLELGPEDCCLNLMPMFHVGAVVDLLLAPLSVGGSVLRPLTMSVPAFFEAVDSGVPTWFQGVPTLLHELPATVRERGGGTLASRLRFIRSVSSALPPEWHREIESAFGVPVIEIYGMTETAGLIASNPLPPGVRKIGSVGRPVSLEVVVRDAVGGEAGPGDRGEIHVRGPGVMAGYEGPEANASGWTKDGWLPTGDEGYFDADGYLFITGRIGERINRGGEKISPREIDEVLSAHPSVREAAAFPVEHPDLGQEVAAVVVPVPGGEITFEDLQGFVSARVAHFKVPKTYFVAGELPRGPGGKLRRRLLPGLVGEFRALVGSKGAVEAPRSETERRVADSWAGLLGVSEVGRESNFFELGGDSLSAATFTAGVESSFGTKVRPAALFDHPTVVAFAALLDRGTAHPMPAAGFAVEGGKVELDPGLHQRVLAAVSTWGADYRDESSIVAGIRTGAPGTPVFWCGQGWGEFKNAADHIPADHPVYATRSLFLFEGKTKRDEAALARLFAREIDVLRAGREVILGGFCAGGRIAFDAACHLRSAGVPVKLVFLHEAFPEREIDVPVALAFTETYEFGPYRRFHRPEMALAKRLRGGWKLWISPRPHGEVYGKESMAEEIPKVWALLDNSAAFGERVRLESISRNAYRAELRSMFHLPWIGAGWPGLVRVRITNRSRHAWPPASRSGLHVGHRWLDAGGEKEGDPGRSVPLPREVASGASISLTIPFHAPPGAGFRWLEVDMVDEGVTWFAEKGSRHPSVPLRLGIQVLGRYGVEGTNQHRNAAQ